jgi:hypothetical protein
MGYVEIGNEKKDADPVTAAGSSRNRVALRRVCLPVSRQPEPCPQGLTACSLRYEGVCGIAKSKRHDHQQHNGYRTKDTASKRCINQHHSY